MDDRIVETIKKDRTKSLIASEDKRRSCKQLKDTRREEHHFTSFGLSSFTIGSVFDVTSSSDI